MREIILDTETTGLDPALGHRVVEIGSIELIHHIPSGRRFHCYVNPEREIPPEALAVHGLSAEFLKEKPTFAGIADELLEFLGDARLVIHNAGFDLNFLNYELELLSKPPIVSTRVVDTLLMARQKHPMGPNSLDALCKRYGISNARREKHGALLDAELLMEVYIELIGGRQSSMHLLESGPQPMRVEEIRMANPRPRPLPNRLAEEETIAHDMLVQALGPGALWRKFSL